MTKESNVVIFKTATFLERACGRVRIKKGFGNKCLSRDYRKMFSSLWKVLRMIDNGKKDNVTESENYSKGERRKRRMENGNSF